MWQAWPDGEGSTQLPWRWTPSLSHKCWRAPWRCSSSAPRGTERCRATCPPFGGFSCEGSIRCAGLWLSQEIVLSTLQIGATNPSCTAAEVLKIVRQPPPPAQVGWYAYNSRDVCTCAIAKPPRSGGNSSAAPISCCTRRLPTKYPPSVFFRFLLGVGWESAGAYPGTVWRA